MFIENMGSFRSSRTSIIQSWLLEIDRTTVSRIAQPSLAYPTYKMLPSPLEIGREALTVKLGCVKFDHCLNGYSSFTIIIADHKLLIGLYKPGLPICDTNRKHLKLSQKIAKTLPSSSFNYFIVEFGIQQSRI